MTSWQATSEDSPTGPDGALRVIGLAAVCVGVAALAAVTFVLSYQGIRAVALQAGIVPRYARGYPLLIDAMLVIVLAAVLGLRGAGLPSRLLAWLTLLVVLGAAAGADTLHATGRTLPHNAAVVTAAVLPWALVFVAFVLLLAMLRHARLRRQMSVPLARESWAPPTDDGQAHSQQSLTAPAPALPVRSPQPWQSVSIVPGFTSQLVPAAAAGAAAGAAVADVAQLAEDAAIDGSHVELHGTDQETIAAEATEPAEGGTSVLVLAAEPTAPADEADPLIDEPDPHTDEPAPSAADAPAESAAEDGPDAGEPEAQTAQDDNDIPEFRRIRSSPTPPEA